MVKLRNDSGGSEDQMPNSGRSCLTETSPGALKMNGNAWEKPLNGSCKTAMLNCKYVENISTRNSLAENGNSSNAVLVNGTQTVNSHCKMSAEKAQAVNGNCSSTVHDKPVNGHNMSEKNDSTVYRNSNNGVSVVDNTTPGEVSAKEVPIINGKEVDYSGKHLNGSSTPVENGSGSNAHTSNSLDEGDSDENQHGFIEVVNKKKRSKNRNKNRRWKQSPNLPPGQSTESLKRDNGNDKNCGVKTSTHLPQKPPSRNFPAVTSSGKSYSSVLANGHIGNSQLSNGRSNISANTQNVTKCTKSNTPVTNCTLSTTPVSVDQLSTELTKSVINNTTSASCKKSNSSTKVEMTDVSAQTDICSQNELSTCQNECLPSLEEANEPEKAGLPSDYIDVGETNGLSLDPAYCESVASNDSGRGDSEILYDEASPYCCEFPREKVSQLIGKGGSFRHEIEKNSGIKFWVYNHELNRSLSVICMIGTGAQIEKAKDIIKERFRHVTLRQYLGNPINPPLSETYLPVLPEGTGFSVVVSCICDPNFFWVQPQDHPHIYALENLERRMSDHFNTVTDAPAIDNPAIGSIIAVPGARDGDSLKWIRGWIINIIPEEEKVVVRYLDHGGDHLVPISSIRPMRHDFFSMPFVAAQCCLYDILPKGGEWSEEARAQFFRLCSSYTYPPIVRVIYKTPECYYVSIMGYDELQSKRVDIASYLILEGYGVRPCYPATEFGPELQQPTTNI